MDWKVKEHASYSELSSLITSAKLASSRNEDPSVIRYLTNYSYIRATGYLETLINALVRDYSGRASSSEIRHYFEKQFRNASGYDSDGLAKFLSKFSTEWHSSLINHKKFENEGPWKTAIDSLYAIRHSQAHGGGQNGNLSQLENYVATTRELLLFLAKDIFRVPGI